ncbi:MAG: hypothetical protein MZW92_69905 [Comamonadaceae bacterium]|nr:hypothetical protein [Comamonadaceae bacterium]
MIVGASCTAELIQDDPGRPGRRAEAAGARGAAGAAGLPAQGKLGRGRDLLPARARAVRPVGPGTGHDARAPGQRQRARCNVLGPTALGFRHRDDVREDQRAAGAHRHRHQRRRAAGRHAGRPAATGRRRLQRRAVSRSRRCPPRSGCCAASASR